MYFSKFFYGEIRGKKLQFPKTRYFLVGIYQHVTPKFQKNFFFTPNWERLFYFLWGRNLDFKKEFFSFLCFYTGVFYLWMVFCKGTKRIKWVLFPKKNLEKGGGGGGTKKNKHVIFLSLKGFSPFFFSDYFFGKKEPRKELV